MLPTGYVKSLIFQLVPGLCKELHNIGNKEFAANAIVLVLCPLVFLVESHMQELTNKAFTSVCLWKNMTIEEKRNIYNGKYSFVFASPESIILNDQWCKEAHVIPKW